MLLFATKSRKVVREGDVRSDARCSNRSCWIEVSSSSSSVVVVESDDRSFQECQILKYRRLSVPRTRTATIRWPMPFTYNPFLPFLGHLLPSVCLFARSFLIPFPRFTSHRYFTLLWVSSGEYFGIRAENRVARISYLAI